MTTRCLTRLIRSMIALSALLGLLGGAVGWAQLQPSNIKVQIQTVVECGRDTEGKFFSRFASVAIHEDRRYPVEFPKGSVRPAAIFSPPQEAIGTLGGGVFRPITMFPAISTAIVPLPPAEPVRRTMLAIFVDYPDSRWNPQLKEVMIESFEKLPGFITRSSRRAMAIRPTILPAEITINSTAASRPNYQTIENEAMERVWRDHAGVIANGYDHIAIVIPRSDFIPFSGVSDLGGPRILFNGEQEWELVAHEFGHNLGLPHAHAWQSWDPEDPISPNGVQSEYGDPYDPMGNYLQGVDYSSAYKYRLGWIHENEVRQVLGSGEHVLYRHDHESASGPVQGLVVGYGANNRYWLEYRKNAPPRYQANGILIRRVSECGLDYPGSVGETEFLDMNDQHLPDFTDSPLTPGTGKAFVDPAQDIEIRVTGFGGVEPNQYVRLEIKALEPPPRLIISNLTNNQVLPLYQKFTVSTVGSVSAHLIARVELWVDDGLKTVSTSAFPAIDWMPSQLGRFTLKVRTIDIYGRTSESPGVLAQVKWDGRPTYATAEGIGVSQLTAGEAGWVALVDGLLGFSEEPLKWDRSKVTADPGFVVRDIAHSRGVYVAVGYGGISYSRDGRHWMPAVLAVRGDFEGVASLGNKWFAVGRRGAVAQSDDGTSWSMVSLPTEEDFVGVVSSPKELVAVGTSGERIRYNGVSWDQPAMVSAVRFKALAYGGGKFVAWAARTNGTDVLCSSKDGRSWIVSQSAGITGEDRITALGGHAGVSYAVGSSLDFEASRPGWLRLIPAREHYTEIVGWGRHLLLVAPTEGSTSFALLEVPADPYRDWSTQAFGDPDHPKADPEADPDSDGLSNLIEYAIWANPMVRENSRDIGISNDRSGRVSFGLGFPGIRPDLRYLIESTADFKTWRFELEYPAREAKSDEAFRFFRLRTERIPY